MNVYYIRFKISSTTHVQLLQWLHGKQQQQLNHIQGDPEVSANLYCNSRASVLGRLRDYLRKLMGHAVTE